MHESFLRTLSIIPSGVIVYNNTKGDEITFANPEAFDLMGLDDSKTPKKTLLKDLPNMLQKFYHQTKYSMTQEEDRRSCSSSSALMSSQTPGLWNFLKNKDFLL
jgi:hypothetical protein